MIPAGSTSAQIEIRLVNDATYQYWDKTLQITLGTPTHASKGALSVHTLSIGDDDSLPGAEPQPDGWPLTEAEVRYITTLPYSVRWPNAVDARAMASVADWWGNTSAPSRAWLDKHSQLVETVQKNKGPIDVLLVGDSITQQWGGWFPPTPDDGVTFTKDAVWPKEFPNYKTVNIGIGGDKTFGVQWRIRHGGVDGIAPRVVVLAIGTNNLPMGQSLPSIAEGVMECVNQLRRKLPSARILVMGVFPRGDNPDAGKLVAPLNAIIKGKIFASDGTRIDSQVHWLDLGPLMTDARGNLKPGVFRDSLHLTQDVGYKLYCDALRPVFNELIPLTGNRPPSLSPIASQLIAPSAVSNPIPFTIGDSETAPEALQIHVTSSNPALIPLSGIALSGTGANRTLTLTPVPGKKGASTIRVQVSDGKLTSTGIFEAQVASFTPVAGRPIYDDTLQSGWNDAPSWYTNRDLASTEEISNGLRSLKVTPASPGGALSLYRSEPLAIAEYQSASFAIHGGDKGGQKLEFALIYDTKGIITQQTFRLTPTAGAWQKFTIPLTPPGPTPDTRLQNIRFRDTGTGAQGAYYVDDLTLDLKSTPTASAPSIQSQPVHASVPAGSAATFTVQASGNPEPTYQWQSAPAGGSSFTNLAGATAASYSIATTTLSDHGRQFRCVISNASGSVTSLGVSLSVLAPPVIAAPKITQQPGSITIREGQTATFTVAVSGEGPFTYRWQSAPKGSSNFANIVGATGASLTTAPLNSSNEGARYRCLITNRGGTVTTQAASLLRAVALPSLGFATASQTVEEAAQPPSHPPVLEYPFEPYAKYPELRLQPTGWPLTSEERGYVLLSEALRYPGVESNKHLPQVWPVTPMAANWGSNGDTRWLDHHTALVNAVQAKKGSTDIILLGDSLTEYWGGGINPAPFNQAWTSHFGQYSTLNLGIGGDKTQNLLWRIHHGALDGASPKVVVLLIGTNNINSTVYNGTPIEAVAQGIKLCTDLIREKCPNAHLVLVKPFPMGPVGTPTFLNGQKINNALDALHFENDPQIHLLDFYRDFFHADGTLKTQYFDSPQSILHLNPFAGYTFYADRLKPLLDSLLAPSGPQTPRVSEVKVRLNLSAAAPGQVTVPFSVSGSAALGSDFTLITPSPLVLPAGATSADIVLRVTDDATVDSPEETVVITLGNPTGATLGAQKVHTVILKDNERPPAAPATK
ncbi:MAG: hypothetical protein RLZZ142_1019 [Verrucomicrobiota bacterium]